MLTELYKEQKKNSKKHKGKESEIKLFGVKDQALAEAVLMAAYYDHAVNQALMLTVEDPSLEGDNSQHEKVLQHQRATEALLSKFPDQQFKNDFIEGMKIRGRQRPINEFVKDMQDRLRKIGGGYGSAIFDENSTLNNGVDI